MEINNSLFQINKDLINKKRQLDESQRLVSNKDFLEKEEDLKDKDYEFGYKIILNYQGEEGLIEDFINEINNDDKKKDPNDMYNYNLNPDKWIKLLNKSILMHYEKHICSNKLIEGEMISGGN